MLYKLLLFVFLAFSFNVNGQPCPATTPTEFDIICPYASDIAVGTLTDVGPTYTWYRNATVVGGPRSGTGQSLSYNYDISSVSSAGHYYIVESRPGYPDVCVFSRTVVYVGEVIGLATTSISANSVSFSWTGIVADGLYEYYVDTQEYGSSGNGLVGSATSVTVGALSGGTDYYIHVAAKCGSGYSEWTTIPFTTAAGQCAPELLGQISGGGTLCNGQQFGIQYYGLSGQSYTLLKNGTAISAAINGVNSVVNFPITYNGVSNDGNYSVKVSKSGCITVVTDSIAVNGKMPVSNIQAQWISATSVMLEWSGNAYESYDYEVTNSPVPPSNATQPAYSKLALIENLLPSTNYYFHIKPNCFQGNAPAWSSFAFTTTAAAAPQCNAGATLTACGTYTTCNIPVGAGEWNFSGSYPNNSTGKTTNGKEVIYNFAATETGVYILDIASIQKDVGVSILYKKASDGCSATGWTAIRSVNYAGKYSIGMLNAGNNYLFLIDNENYAAAQLSFKICKATTAPPPLSGQCNSAFPYTSVALDDNGNLPSFIVYPNKEEYLLDANGNLVASLRTEEGSEATEIQSFSIWTNTGSIRRDNENREYLNRDFTLITNYPLLARFYFTSSELTSIINEPNDGISDVSNVSDLQASSVQIYDYECNRNANELSIENIIGQTNSGSYDAGSFFIEIPTTISSKYFLHGGNEPLNYTCPSAPGHYLSFEEYFNQPNKNLLPPCWRKTNSEADISFEKSSSSPAITPFEGSRFLFFNAKNYPAGASSILNAPVISTISYNSADIEFYWYNSNNPLFTSSLEGVRIEYSLDNANWTLVNFVQRHDGSLTPGSGKWKKKRMALPAAAGNKSDVFIRFIFTSQGGENCALDALSITPSAACADVESIGVSNITASAVSFSWPAVAGVTGYEYQVKTTFSNETTGVATSLTSATVNGLSPNTTYYVYVKPKCTASVSGAYNVIKVVTPFACRAGMVKYFYDSPYYGTYYTYQWQVDNGSGFIDIINNSVYSGATTTSLILTNPPGNYSGYKYRCTVLYTYFTGIYAVGETFVLKFGNIWKGTSNNLWNNPANWSCGTIPDQYTDVQIPGGTNFSPNVNVNTSCKSVKVEANAILNVNTGITLTITGSQ